MSDRMLLATHKGFFTVERRGASGTPQWTISQTAFPGDPVSMVLFDSRDSTTYAALNLGHFGVKLHRSTDGGKTWDECAAPVYPGQPAPTVPGTEPPAGPRGDTVQQVWSLEEAPRSQVSCGRGPSRADCFVPRIAAPLGSWCRAYGIGLNAKNGSEAAPSSQGFTRSA